MNKTVPALIDQQESTIGNRQYEAIQTYQARYAEPYLSGNYVIDQQPTLGPYGMPYWMAGIATQTCENFVLNAPVAQQKSSMTHIARTLSNAGQAPVGQAPTRGIYTGVEGSC